MFIRRYIANYQKRLAVFCNPFIFTRKNAYAKADHRRSPVNGSKKLLPLMSKLAEDDVTAALTLLGCTFLVLY